MPVQLTARACLEAVELEAEQRGPWGGRCSPVLLPLLVEVLPWLQDVREKAFADLLETAG